MVVKMWGGEMATQNVYGILISVAIKHYRFTQIPLADKGLTSDVENASSIQIYAIKKESFNSYNCSCSMLHFQFSDNLLHVQTYGTNTYV